MNSPQNIIKQLNPQYFWDVDPSRLNDIKGKGLIIERVITLGNLKEIFLLIERYGKAEFYLIELSRLCQIPLN